MEFDICPKNNPYKFKNGQYCCSEPIQKEFDQCDGVEEKCHYNSGCDNCKFFFCWRYKILTFDIAYKSCYLGLNRYMKCSYIASLVKIKSESKIEIFG